MARANGLEVFLAAQDQLHRPPRLHRKQHHQRLDVRLHLVAEAGADTRCQAAQLRHRQAKRFAHARLDPEDRLIGRPQRYPARRVDLCQGAARLQRQVGLGLGLEMVLDDQIAAGPGALDVALQVRRARTQVALGAGVEHPRIGCRVVVHQRGVGLQCIGWIEHRPQHLVIDPDQSRCGARNLHSVGSNACHDLADVSHLAFGKCRLVLDERAHVMTVVQIVAGDDRANTLERHGCGHVVAADAGMRVCALDDGAMQHAGPIQVGNVLRGTAELFSAASSCGTGLADRVAVLRLPPRALCLGSLAHDLAPSCRSVPAAD